MHFFLSNIQVTSSGLRVSIKLQVGEEYKVKGAKGKLKLNMKSQKSSLEFKANILSKDFASRLKDFLYTWGDTGYNCTLFLSQISTSNVALDVTITAPRGNNVQHNWEIKINLLGKSRNYRLNVDPTHSSPNGICLVKRQPSGIY